MQNMSPVSWTLAFALAFAIGLQSRVELRGRLP